MFPEKQQQPIHEKNQTSRFMCISILIGQSKKTLITVAESSVLRANTFLNKGVKMFVGTA